MIFRTGILALLFAGTASGTTPATVSDPMTDAVAHYVAIGTLLAGDSVDGIAEHAQAILEHMSAQHGGGSDTRHGEQHGQHAGSGDMDRATMADKHETMEAAMTTLAGKCDLDVARAAYKQFSAEFVPVAQLVGGEHAPSLSQWAVMTCPMAKAEWIQADGPLTNPYYGSKMLRCGKKLANLGTETGTSESTAESHGGHH